MKTKVPFASRCLTLCVVVLAASCTLAWKLVQLQVVDSANCGGIAAEELIYKERLPAQRGIVMDRNEEILTNNIQSAEIVADRHHLRDVTAVVEGLAYSMAVHDEAWNKDEDKERRRKLWRRYRAELLEKARLDLSAEELAELRSKLRKDDARGNRMLKYDQEVCDLYCEAHDAYVAELLHPFLSKVEIKDEQTGALRGMTKEDIIRLIAQPEIAEYNAKAAAEKREPRNFKQEIVLAKGLTLDAADKIREALRKANVRGIMVQSSLRRSYVMPESLAHVLGYVNHENKGMSGVESYFQSYLAGIDGLREYRHGARGQVLPNEDDRYMAPKHGLNLRLTIDMRLQHIVEQELLAGLKKYRAPRGCMIVVDPKTGDILAMANYPTFNLNTKDYITPKGIVTREEEKALIAKDKRNAVQGEFNFACQARYEPGSTFKVVAVTAAVDKKIMSINGVVSCAPFSVGGGSKAINDGRFNYGAQPLWGVLKKSSNPGAARIALACKWPLYKQYVERFGLHQPAGIDLPSGGACLLADGNNIVNFSRIAYGYSVSVSPLHMAMVYAAIANGGKRMKPRLIDRIIKADGSTYDECAPQMVEQVMSEKTSKDLLFALNTVTESNKINGRGTATRAAIPGFRVAGKTGTAKKVKEGGGYHEGLYTVSFAGIFPVDNPRIVVMTVIDEPHPTDCNAGGGTVAAPIFRAAVERMIDVLNIAPSDPEAYEKYLKEGKQAEQNP